MLRHDWQILALIGICGACSLAFTSMVLARAADNEPVSEIEVGEIMILSVPPRPGEVRIEHAFEWRESRIDEVRIEQAFKWRNSKPVVFRSGPTVTWMKWQPEPAFSIETGPDSPPSLVGVRYLWEKPFWNRWRKDGGPLNFEFRFEPSK